MLGCPELHHGEIKSNRNHYSREEANIQVPAGTFSHILQDICYRIANTSLNSFIEKETECSNIAQNYGNILKIIFHNTLRGDVIIFLFFLEKQPGQEGKVKYQRLYYVLMAESQ